jgi:hypothetical protein
VVDGLMGDVDDFGCQWLVAASTKQLGN